jgi:hypothetical protein
MGYLVTVVRTVGKERVPIAREELARAVSNLAQMLLTRDHEGRPVIAILRDGKADPALTLHHGEIWANSPDRATLQAMIELAQLLKARVRGDGFETYRTVDDVYDHPDDHDEKNAAEQAMHNVRRRADRRQWILTACVVFVFVIGALVVTRCDR